MDINDAVRQVEAFFDDYAPSDDSRPTEVRIRPSGDDASAIKIWFNFPDASDEQVAARKAQCVAALKAAHPEVEEFTLEVRAESI